MKMGVCFSKIGVCLTKMGVYFFPAELGLLVFKSHDWL